MMEIPSLAPPMPISVHLCDAMDLEGSEVAKEYAADGSNVVVQTVTWNDGSIVAVEAVTWQAMTP